MGGRGGSSGKSGSMSASSSPFATTTNKGEQRKVSGQIDGLNRSSADGAYFEANGKAASILASGREDINSYRYGSSQVYEVIITGSDFSKDKRIAHSLEDAKRIAKSGLGLNGGK